MTFLQYRLQPHMAAACAGHPAGDEADRINRRDALLAIASPLLPRSIAGDLVAPLAISASAVASHSRADASASEATVAEYGALLAYLGPASRVRVSDALIQGVFEHDPASPAVTDGGIRFAHASGKGAWRRVFAGAVDVRWYGAKGDWTGSEGTDDTRAIQAAIDANKGKEILFPSPGRFLHAGVMLDGESYARTRLVCAGELVLKPRQSPRHTNFGGAWIGLLIKDTHSIMLRYKGHGNRSHQPGLEHTHLVGLAGARGIDVPEFRAREVRGDAIYISQSDWTRSSSPSRDLRFGTFAVVNSADDGRNAMSIIAAENVYVEDFHSVKVGGVINGVTQPGGFDIEPNADHQSVANVVVKRMRVDTAGNFGIQIYGQRQKSAGGNVMDVSVQAFDIVSRCQSKSATPVAFRHCANVRASGTIRFDGETQAQHVGLLADNFVKGEIQISATGGSYGARLGPSAQVSGLQLQAECSGYAVAAIESSDVSQSRITVTARNGKRGSRALYTRAWSRRGVQQRDVQYTIDAPRSADSADVGGYNESSDPVGFSNVRFVGGSLRGYTSREAALKNFGPGISTTRVAGIDE